MGRSFSRLSLGVNFLLSFNVMAQASYDASEGSNYTNAQLEQGDRIVESLPLLSSHTQQFLKEIRNTAEQACTNRLGAMAGTESCDVYSKGYVDSADYFVGLEKRIEGELRVGEDMKIQRGETESGEAAKVIEIACDGTGAKDAARGVSTFDFPQQKYSVVAVLHNAETCDGVKPNHPQDGVLQIDSRNKQLCNFYFVCGAKVEGASRRALARSDRNTFRPTPSTPAVESLSVPPVASDDSSSNLSRGLAGGNFNPNDNSQNYFSVKSPSGEIPPLNGYMNASAELQQ